MLIPPNSAKEREPTGVHSARNPRGCQLPSGVLGPGFRDNGGTGRGGPSLPACAAMVPGRGNGEVAGTAAAPLRSRSQPLQAPEELSPGRKRDASPTAPGEDQTAPGTGVRPPTPRPAPGARPRPLARALWGP